MGNDFLFAFVPDDFIPFEDERPYYEEVNIGRSISIPMISGIFTYEQLLKHIDFFCKKYKCESGHDEDEYDFSYTYDSENEAQDEVEKETGHELGEVIMAYGWVLSKFRYAKHKKVHIRYD